MRLLTCLFLLCSSVASAGVVRPDFDRGVDASRILQGIRADKSALPALKAEAQNVFEYRLAHYPKEAGACLPAAQTIGADVARVAGVKVLRSVCDSEAEGGFQITVSYEAPEKLSLVSTVRATADGEHGFGAFATYAACQAGLADEKAAFQAATGLEPAVAYCLSDAREPKAPWSARIDGFGKAQVSPQLSGAILFAIPPDLSHEKFLGTIKENLKAQGLNVRSVAWHGEFGYANVRVAYYAQERINLQFDEPARLDTEAQCRAALAEVDKHLAGRAQPVIRFCGRSMTAWEVTWMFNGEPSLRAVKSSENFKSYAACGAALPETIKRYREELGHPVLGAVCSYEVLDYGWKAVLLEE